MAAARVPRARAGSPSTTTCSPRRRCAAPSGRPRKRADGVVAASAGHRRRARDLPATILHPGVDLDRVHPDAAPRRPAARRCRSARSCRGSARISRSRSRARMPDVHFTFAGAPLPGDADCRDARAPPRPNVTFAGRRSTCARALADAHVLLHCADASPTAWRWSRRSRPAGRWSRPPPAARWRSSTARASTRPATRTPRSRSIRDGPRGPRRAAALAAAPIDVARHASARAASAVARVSCAAVIVLHRSRGGARAAAADARRPPQLVVVDVGPDDGGAQLAARARRDTSSSAATTRASAPPTTSRSSTSPSRSRSC